MSQPRKLKVFVASPNDVLEEKNALAKLIGDINDVLAYLAPEKNLTIELVRYETHAYPDIGAPQEVINREIPVDYDIFVGIMWKRIGTRTASEPSGTVEEFRRALAHRRQGPLPRIMFYFCDETIPIPTAQELEQLTEVVKFRVELDSQGLTSRYPLHSQFVENVRGGLLRAIRDILHESDGLPRTSAPEPATVDTSSREASLELAREYDKIRSTMKSGDERTRIMEGIFSRMKIAAPKVHGLLDAFESDDSAGVRLMAIAILNMFPSADHLEWLAHRMNPESEKPFLAYHAAVALLEAAINLPVEDCEKLKAALATAREFAERLKGDSDRVVVLSRAQQELARKCSPTNVRAGASLS